MAGFDILSAAYDAMIDWDKRLANESVLYRAVFDRVAARCVLDAACGTGRHAAMFASWGLRAQGADLSQGMIEHCRAAYAGRHDLEFVVRSFTEQAGREFDAVICVGNSLALLDDVGQVDRAIAALVRSCRPGGAIILHALNVYSREDGPVRWDKCIRRKLGEGDYLITKGTHRSSSRGYVDFLLARLDQPKVDLQTRCVPFLALEGEHIANICRSAGCSAAELYGDYRMSEFNRNSCSDLIIVATR